MESVKLDAYLFFTGTCREAMEFYRDVFGGELTVQTFGEMPGMLPERKDRVMHARLGGGPISLMACDGDRQEPYGTSFISLSLSGTDDSTLRGYFEKLSAGGTVTSPLKTEVWGDVFGSLTDKFGVDWMVNISQA